MAATKRKSNPTKKRRTRKKATKRRTSKRRKNPTRKRRTRKKATKRRTSKRRKNPVRKRRTRKKATKRRRTSKRRKNPTRKRRTTSKRRRRTSKRRKNPNNSVAKRNPGGVLSATEGKACSASYPTGKGVMDKLLSVDSLIENGTLLAAAYTGKLLTKSYDMATSMALDPLLKPKTDAAGKLVPVGAGMKAGIGVIELIGAITVGNVLDFMVFNRQKAWILNPRNGAVIHAQLLEHSVSGILKNFIKRPAGQAMQFLYDGTLGQPVKMHKYQTRHHTSGRLGLRKQGGQSYLRQPIREMQADRYYKGRLGVLPEAADRGFSMAGRRADAIYAAPVAPPRSPGLSGGYRAG